MYLFVLRFLSFNAVKPCEICATKAKYLNQCITPGKMLREFDPKILKSKSQIRAHASVTAINLFFPLYGIVVYIK